ALIEAARTLLQDGGMPSVAEAAEAARVSRATAYRYFPTHEALLVEITKVGPAVEPVERALAGLASPDPERRLSDLLDAFNPIVFGEETLMRTALRGYLDTWLATRARGEPAPPLREGRRLRWLDMALAPVRRELTDRQYRHLRAALALTLGSEALVVMRDVCRIDDDTEAANVLKWTALALLRAGLGHARTAKGRRAKV
ncbi:MAG TPA: TetR family transcriptional regulator, partial [Casimicrobiaceae bacterium]|nr:TetR family transcriptional regulator [Casimicrobiaceae bacterium]